MVMSSDADELGGFDPSTPNQHAKKRKAPASRSVPGPSKVSRVTKGRQQRSTRESPVVVEDDDNAVDVDDDVPEVVQDDPRKEATANVHPAPATNGKSGKARAKAKADSFTNGHRNGTELVVIDERDDDDPPPAKSLPLAKKVKSSTSVTTPAEKGAYSREFEKLREERDLYKEKSEQLSENLRQLIQTRNTEPEEELVSRKARYDAASKAQEELIKELTTQVSRLTPMMKENRTSTSLFLTREGVDEDKRIFEERLKELQGQLTQKDGVIRDKDTRIAALNEQLETTQADLKAEIAHTQSLHKAPGSAVRDLQHGATIRLYEDLTNLMVLNTMTHASPYAHLGDFEEITYRCVFSHTSSASLSFLLTSMHQPKPSSDPARSPTPQTKDDLQNMVRYTPLELEKESQEHIQKLDFLADTFTFAYDQMDYFLKTLNDHFSSLSEEQDD